MACEQAGRGRCAPEPTIEWEGPNGSGQLVARLPDMGFAFIITGDGGYGYSAIDYRTTPAECSHGFKTREAAKLWCECRVQHPIGEVGGEMILLPIPGVPPATVVVELPHPDSLVTVAGVDGVPQAVPAADAPEF